MTIFKQNILRIEAAIQLPRFEMSCRADLVMAEVLSLPLIFFQILAMVAPYAGRSIETGRPLPRSFPPKISTRIWKVDGRNSRRLKMMA
jgi:hypothetical protein